MTFELPLTEQKVNPHQVTALHLIVAFSILGAGGLCYLLGIYTKVWANSIFGTGTIPATGLIAAGLAMLFLIFFRNRWLQQPAVNRAFRVIELCFALVMLAGALALKWWVPAAISGILAAAVAFALYWENNRRHTLSIRVDDEGIKLPVTSRKRGISWQNVNNVLLRYGILTIDCADNSLYQWNIGKVSIDKDGFEAFCQAHIAKGMQQRSKNNW
jgi:hypothetical protein